MAHRPFANSNHALQPRIVISRDDVEIEGVKVPRPPHIPPSYWYSYWGEHSDNGVRVPNHNP